MDLLPEELLRYILQKLSGKDTIKCRQVCKLWKEIIDDCINTDEFWRHRCTVEYSEIYLEAKRKALSSLTWREMYKSLSVWSNLNSAEEQWKKISEKEEWKVADCVLNVEKGVLSILYSDFLIFKDVNKTKVDRHLPLDGCIIKYHENDNFIATLHENYLPKKRSLEIFPKESNEIKMTFEFEDVKDFICVNNTIYYAKIGSGVYRYDFQPSSLVALQNNELVRSSHVQTINDNEQKFLFKINDVVLMSYKDNKVIAIHNRIGYRTMLFYDEETDTVTREHLPRGEDIFQKLVNLDFPKYMVEKNWYTLEQVMSDHLDDTKNKLKQHINSNFFQISALKQYGYIVFVGSDMGHVLVFQNPYNNGKIDFNVKPVKIYYMYKKFKMIHRNGCIYYIDVVESKTGPVLIVSLEENIYALKLSYACEKKQKNNAAKSPQCMGGKRKRLQ